MTLKLEVGKTYVDKKGEHINIVGTSPYDNGYKLFVGIDKNDEPSTYYTDGEYLSGGGYNNLIAEHKEPVVHEAIVTWYEGYPNGKVCVCIGGEPTGMNTVLKQEKITYEEK